MTMTRDEAVAALREAGFNAKPRDWILGETIYIFGRPAKDVPAGIEAYESCYCLVPNKDSRYGAWYLEDFNPRPTWKPVFKDLDEAVSVLIEKLVEIRSAPRMKVRVSSKAGQTAFGEVTFSKGRGKTTVAVHFQPPIAVAYPSLPGETPKYHLSFGEEFRLATGARTVWGQGMDEDVDDWYLHPDDCKAIIDSGGG